MAKRNTIFKAFESQIGEWFGVYRNPLSGRNNRDDSGKKRLGDIIYPYAVVEGKTRRKLATISRVYETKKLAENNGKQFVHFERIVGDRETIVLVCDEKLITKLVKLMDLLFRDEKSANEILEIINKRLEELRKNEYTNRENTDSGKVD